MNNIKTLEASFVQMASNGTTSEGKLYIEKPSKIRMEYAPPAEGVVFYQLDDPAAVRNIYLSQRRQEPDVRQQKLLDYLWSQSLLQR